MLKNGFRIKIGDTKWKFREKDSREYNCCEILYNAYLDQEGRIITKSSLPRPEFIFNPTISKAEERVRYSKCHRGARHKAVFKQVGFIAILCMQCFLKLFSHKLSKDLREEINVIATLEALNEERRH